ncbi:hypothetical protein WDW37_14650 [Bdellovibrionota bacterium FG-1]
MALVAPEKALGSNYITPRPFISTFSRQAYSFDFNKTPPFSGKRLTSLLGGEFYYWGTHGGVEVDFIWVCGKRAIGFEVKATHRWKDEYSTALRILVEEKKIQKAFGIYLGSEILSDRGITILPFKECLKRLGKNEVF